MPIFDISSYLDRIGISDVSATSECLARLQSAQIRAIPFENIDPLLGVEPELSLRAVSRKLLGDARGGYCFEQNLLFQAALEAVGFRTGRRLARVWLGRKQAGARTHLSLVCEIDGQAFLADAGFGGPAPLTPLAMEAGREQDAPNGRYRLTTSTGTGEWIVSKRDGENDLRLYGFDDAGVTDADIAASNFLCCRWERSPFTSHLMVNGYDGETRLALFDRRLTLEADGRREQRILTDIRQMREILVDRLGIAVDDARLDTVWSRIESPKPEDEEAAGD